MPLYDYKCKDCGKVTEVRHGFNDSHADPCPACGGTMQRVFSAAPIVFKGSGYYITDSRKSGPAEAAANPASEPAKTPSGDSSTAATPATPAAPAAPSAPAAKSSEPAA
jgi:putative FmdB family regulatory protein